MTKHTFRYCATHKADEAYMKQMCARGWAAERLVEGFWTFRKCRPDEYCYRIYYLRGMTKKEIDVLKTRCAAAGIEFVSRYSFWAIFRSSEPFELYSREEERNICRKIYAPMPIGAVISWLLFAAGIVLACRIHPLFWIFAVLVGLYGAMCSWLAFSYRNLLKRLS